MNNMRNIFVANVSGKILKTFNLRLKVISNERCLV